MFYLNMPIILLIHALNTIKCISAELTNGDYKDIWCYECDINWI